MKELKDGKTITNSGACEDCERQEGEPRTFFVHHCSGLVTEVPEVTELHMTDTQLVLQRRDAQPAVFPRRDVYFACCEHDEEPSPC